MLVAAGEPNGSEFAHRSDGSMRVFAINNAFEHWDALLPRPPGPLADALEAKEGQFHFRS
jgi:hypothetical protein